MDIFKHQLCTHTLGKPSDLTDDQCQPLPVGYETIESGTYAVWKPTEEEIAALVAGSCIGLWVRTIGNSHPVVGLTVIPEE